MSAALILANITALETGQAGVSRRDGVIGATVTLRNNDDAGVSRWRWTLVSRPRGSAASLSSSGNATTDFELDVRGTYLIELAVDQEQDGQVARILIAVTDSFGFASVPLRLPAASEETEANWKYKFGPTLTANLDGWQPDLIEFLDEVATHLELSSTSEVLDGSATPIEVDTTGPRFKYVDVLELSGAVEFTQAGGDPHDGARLSILIENSDAVTSWVFPANWRIQNANVPTEKTMVILTIDHYDGRYYVRAEEIAV